MKKLFIIAMCILSIGFVSCKKENAAVAPANERFVGVYEGQARLEGNVNLSFLGQQFINEIDSISVVTCKIVAGEKDNEVIATIADFTQKGVCTENHIEFEQAAFEGLPIPCIQTMAADLNEGALILKSEIKGDDDYQEEGITIHCSVLIKMEGELAKQQ